MLPNKLVKHSGVPQEYSDDDSHLGAGRDTVSSTRIQFTLEDMVFVRSVSFLSAEVQ